jgi:ATP-dependent helicase HrpB
VGEGNPTGPVFDFLLGEGCDECGVLLAMAYPDRVAVRRSKGGAFQLSSGNGAASVPKFDAEAREEVLVIAELTGDAAGGGARNDRVRLAAPVPLAALEPPAPGAAGDDGGGCLAEHLCEWRDAVMWAPASKVGLYKLANPVDLQHVNAWFPQLERTWFQPLEPIM